MTTTENTEFGQVRIKRHNVRHLLGKAGWALTGEPGIDQAHQLRHVNNAIELAKEAVVALDELHELVANRNWPAYQEAKHRHQANQIDLDDDSDVDDDDDDDDES
jgi:hypothetical protein